jgi:hypothetical protein
VLEEVFEIMLDLESESALLGPIVTGARMCYNFCETQGLKVLEETSHGDNRSHFPIVGLPSHTGKGGK